MYSRDHQNYLRKSQISIPDSEQNRKVMIIFDSKGFFFERLHTENKVEKNIIFESFQGRTTYQAANFIQKKKLC